jgi:TonB family protein
MRTVLFAAALAVALASSAQAEEPARLITDPQWIEQPSADDLTAAYPDRAFKDRPTGAVSVECKVSADGLLGDCKVLSESPKGQGFGSSAQYAAVYFRMPAATPDGKLTAGAIVRLSLRFAPPADIDTPPKAKRSMSVSDVEAVWPTAAHGGEGWALARCIITVHGVLRDCQVVREEPPGKGFGSAALLLAPSMVFSPAMKAGQPVEAPFPLLVRWKGEGPAGEGLRIVSDYLWESAPSFSDLTAAYPKGAKTKALQGHVVLRCGLKDDGRLKDCDIITERPEHEGFGQAAKSLAPLFKAVPLPGDTKRSVLSSIRVDVAVQFAPPSPRQLSKLEWTRQPQSLVAAFPDKAADAGLSTGRATIDCAVGKDGALADCSATAEDPQGMGFGPAGIKVAQIMAVNPWTDEGLPADGAHVSFTIRFMNKAAADAAAAPTQP